MPAYRVILTICFALFLFACAATPVLTGKSDMSRAIKQKAPIVAHVDISSDGRYALSGGFDSFILWDIFQGEKYKHLLIPRLLWGIQSPLLFRLTESILHPVAKEQYFGIWLQDKR